MATIVVFAGGKDADAASKALEDAGLDFQIVGPTPANLLHIVIGMVGGDDGEDDADADKDPADDAGADEADAADAEATADDSVDMTEEGLEQLGSVVVEGETIKAIRFKELKEHSLLAVQSLEIGARTSFQINESKFSFWPSDMQNVQHRVTVQANNHRSTLEIPITEGSEKTGSVLVVGKDLIDLFIK